MKKTVKKSSKKVANKKDTLRVNIEIPMEFNDIRKETKIKWKDIIRLGLSCALETLTKDKQISEKAMSEAKLVDEALQTPQDKREHLESGPIEMPLMLKTRQYNVFNKIKRMWEQIEFKDIMEGEIFRVVENGHVVLIGGHKYVSYVDYPVRTQEGELVVQVVGRRMTF